MKFNILHDTTWALDQVARDAVAKVPVRPGQIWRVGGDVFGCADLQHVSLAPLLDTAGVGCASVVCTEPPTSERTNRLWRRGAAAHVGEGAGVEFDVLLEHLADVCAESKARHVVTWAAQSAPRRQGTDRFPVEEALAVRGFRRWCHLDVPVPFSLQPFVLLSLSKGEGVPLPSAVADRWEAVPAVMRALPHGEPQTVLDPCMGRGEVARCAWQAGHRVIGIEINPARVADCLLRHAERTGFPPVLTMSSCVRIPSPPRVRSGPAASAQPMIGTG